MPFMYRTRRDKERGGRLVLLINKRFSTTPLKGASVLLTKNRYSCKQINHVPPQNHADLVQNPSRNPKSPILLPIVSEQEMHAIFYCNCFVGQHNCEFDNKSPLILRTFTRRAKYTFALLGAVRLVFLLRPPAFKSIPCR